MHDDRPEPLLVVLDVDLAGLDDVDDPEGEVEDQQEAHYLPAWLSPQLTRGVDGPVGGVRNEERLQEGLEDDSEVGAEGEQRLQPLVVAEQGGAHSEQEDARLGGNQNDFAEKVGDGAIVGQRPRIEL